MSRIALFWGGLPLGSKLQHVALALILGSVFVTRDLNPRFRWFGLPLWQITAPLILLTIVIGWILLPLMMRNLRRTQRILSALGCFVLILGILLATQRWALRLMIVQVSMTTLLWLDLSCSFWFISELQLLAMAFRAAQAETMDGGDLESDEEQDTE